MDGTACKLTVAPWQMGEVFPLIYITGGTVFWKTVKVVVLLHPLALVTLATYVPALVTVLVAVVRPLSHR